MSDLSVTVHNFEDMLAGKTDFNGFLAGEGKLIEDNIASLAAPLQPAAQLLYSSFKAGASKLVGAGETALGAFINQNSDAQAAQLLNLMQLAGIPTQGPLSAAEQAALVTLINGLKTGLDRLGLKIAGQTAAPATTA
jgi:hypothetical protein